MARTRLLKPGFFKNDELAELSPLARLLFAGLWTIADCDGLLANRPKRIKAELLPYDKCNIEGLLNELAAAGFIHLYDADGVSCIHIPTFVAHQNPHKNEGKSGLPLPLEKNHERLEKNHERLEKNREDSRANREDSRANREDSHTNPALTFNPLTLTLSSSAQPSSPTQAIAWSRDDGWLGISEDDVGRWEKAYPACDLERQLAAMHEWLLANPKKAIRKNWRRFITNWLGKNQERGGDVKSNARYPPDSEAAEAEKDAEAKRQERIRAIQRRHGGKVKRNAAS